MPAPAPEPLTKPFPPRAKASGDVTWFDLLKAADARGVQMRALLNLHPSPKPPRHYKDANFDLVESLNTLGRGGAISDSRYLWLNGTHHQKLVLVSNVSGLIAYCGTCDVHVARIDGLWCEVQCRMMGEAAADLYRIFSARWQEHTQALARLGSERAYLEPMEQLRATAPRAGNLLVQVATTYGQPDPRQSASTAWIPLRRDAGEPVGQPAPPCAVRVEPRGPGAARSPPTAVVLHRERPLLRG